MFSFGQQIYQWVDQLPLRYWGHRLMDLPILLKWTKIPRHADILEVGCGMGHVARFISENHKCKTYTAIDTDPQMIALAETKTGSDSKVLFEVADVCKLDFKKESFDVVIAFDVLHLIPQWQKALREIHRVLKDNGQLLLREYSIESFTMPGIGIFLQRILNHPFESMFDQVELVTFLRKNGFLITHQNDSQLMTILTATKKSLHKKNQ